MSYQLKREHKWILIVGIIISAMCLYYSVQGINTNEVWKAFSEADYWMAFPMLLAYAAYYGIKAVRWRLLLSPLKKVSTKQIFSPMMLGFFGNNIFPAHLGEFIRMYLVARRFKLSNTEVLATIVVERLFDFFVMMLFLLYTIFIGGLAPLTVTSTLIIVALGMGFLILFYIMSKNSGTAISIFESMLFVLPNKWKIKTVSHIRVSIKGLQAINSISSLVYIAVSSIVQWLLMGLTIYCALIAFDIVLPFYVSLIVVVCMVFAVMIPAAPGFFGLIQVAFIIALENFGINQVDAVTASIFFHIVTFFAIILLGFYLLKYVGTNLQQLKIEVELQHQ